ncbi:MAG: AraC family transcriptional regulator [Rhodospirillales bacterium]|nr:AraC family transcriptional regulator [Rhodospirillales bacterium]
MEKLLRRRGLPALETDDPAHWVPTHAVVMLAQDVQRIIGPEAFGVWLERTCDLSQLGPFNNVLRRSRTLYDALNRYHRFYREFRSYANISMARRGDDLWIRRSVDSRMAANNGALQLYGLSEITRIVHLAAGDSWQPNRIVLQSDTDSILKTMPHLAGADAVLDAEFCAIAIPLGMLSRPLTQRHGSGVMALADDDAAAMSPPPEGFSESVLAIISTHFLDCYPAMNTVAESIGVNARTVQRRLAADGLTYRDLIDWYRFETAKRLILEDRVRLTDVAAELEYNDAGSFTRAFRRWAGVSPREYRALHTMA